MDNNGTHNYGQAAASGAIIAGAGRGYAVWKRTGDPRLAQEAGIATAGLFLAIFIFAPGVWFFWLWWTTLHDTTGPVMFFVCLAFLVLLIGRWLAVRAHVRDAMAPRLPPNPGIVTRTAIPPAPGTKRRGPTGYVNQ